MCTWRQMPFPTGWGRRKAQQKSQRKVVQKDQLLCWKSLFNRGVWIKILIRENLYSTWTWKFGIKAHRPTSLKAPGTKLKFGKERVHLEELSKSVRLMSVVLACPNSGKDHMERLRTKKDAPAEQQGIWREILTSSRIQTKLRFVLLLKKGCGHPLQRDQRIANS